MNKKGLLSLLILSTLSITACGKDKTSDDVSSPTNSSSEEVSNSSTSSPATSNESSDKNSNQSDSSSAAAEEYVIAVMENSNVEYSCPKKAKAGEIVQITVTAKDGFMVTSVVCNNTPCTGSNGVYTFVMPKTSAIITIKTSLVDTSGYILASSDGSESYAKFEQEGQLFVARNVSFSQDTNVAYKIDGELLSCVAINTEKSFANLGVITGGGFKVAGNATYDFYYDPADIETPCYVVRTKVNNLPTNESMVASLFNGEIKSTSTLNPIGVNHVEYSAPLLGENYTWDLYSNNSSLATIKDASNTEVGIVYKAQKGNVYEVIDEYAEASYGGGNYVERGDNTIYSGRYDIVDTTEYGKRNYQQTQSYVNIDANSFSHSVESIYFDSYMAFSNGYINNVMDDVDVVGGYFNPDTMLPDDNESVKSVLVGDNGDFKVNINFYVMWQNSSYYTNKDAYITYAFEVTFDKAGSIKEGSYKETLFTSDYFNFSTNKFTVKPSSVKATSYFTFAYGYGDAIEGQPNVDTTPYFISSLSNVKYEGKEGNVGTVSVSEELKNSEGSTGDYNNYGLSFDFAPSTALDAWQYGISASSNHKVISPKRSDTPFQFVAVGFGDTNLTISNHTDNAATVKETYKLTVENTPFIISAYMNTTTCDYAYRYEDIAAVRGDIYAGKSYTIQMNATTKTHNTLTNNMGLSFTAKSAVSTKTDKTTVNETNPASFIDIKYDDETGLLTLDVKKTKLPADTSYVTVIIDVQSKFSSSEIWRNSELTMYLHPGEEAYDSLVGEWECIDSTYDDGVVFTDTDSTTYAGYKTGVITYYDINSKVYNTYEFSYLYDSDKVTLSVKLDSINEQPLNSTYLYDFRAVIFEDNAVGFYLLQTEWAGADDTTETQLLGGYEEDDEGWDRTYYYTTFTKKN